MVMPEVPSAVIVKDLVVVSSKAPGLPLRPSPLFPRHATHAPGCLHSPPSLACSWASAPPCAGASHGSPSDLPQLFKHSTTTPSMPASPTCHHGGACSQAPPSVAHLTASQLGPVHSTSQNPESASSPPPPLSHPGEASLVSAFCLFPHLLPSSPFSTQHPWVHLQRAWPRRPLQVPLVAPHRPPSALAW